MRDVINKTNSNRKEYVDIAKGIAIIFVVLGHTTHIDIARSYFLQSCLPIFFFVSGLFYKPEKFDRLFTYIKKQAGLLLIPYVFFFLLTFSYWALIERNFRGADVSLSSQILGLFYGNIGDYMTFNGALWFLPCLFLVQIIFAFVNHIKFKAKSILLIILFFASIFLIKYDITYLPFGLTSALFFISYYSIGFFAKKLLPILEEKSKLVLFFVAIILLLLQILWLKVESKPLPFLTIHYGKDLFFGILSILFVFSVSNLIRKNAGLQYLGKNSLVIFALQEPIYRAIIFITSKILNSEVELIRNNLIYCFIICAITIFIILPAILIYKLKIEPIFIQKVNRTY